MKIKYETMYLEIQIDKNITLFIEQCITFTYTEK